MERTKVFVSYSHRDRRWLDRLKVHLSILQRRGLVHVWSDTRIEVGARWQEEIESALAEARAAVLLVSANFLASDYIWNEEMPRILAHQKEGMVVLPLVVRPCAWLIAPELAELNARPADGRPLSLGTEAEVDRDLAAFVYEIAGRLKQLPDVVASEGIEDLRARGKMRSGPPPAAPPFGSMETGEVWVGVYQPTERQLRLTVEGREEQRFRGTVEYLDDGSVTDAEGQCLTVMEASALTEFENLSPAIGTADLAVRFREIRVSKPGEQSPQLDGEYLAVIAGEQMRGVWRSNGRNFGDFELWKVKNTQP